MRSTVAIPLHRSARWVGTVGENIERLAGHARIIVSDATGEDDALEQLRREFGGSGTISLVGPRDVPRGWVPHANDLLARAETEFFMWLPHDDAIESDWVTEGEAVLDATPGAILALGDIRRYGDTADAGVPVFAPFATARAADRVRAALTQCARGNTSPLGAAFRGLVRTAATAPLPRSTPDDAWADVYWATRQLTRGSFAHTPAFYDKRWIAGSAHSSWPDPRRRDDFARQLLASVDELPDGDRAVPWGWRTRMRLTKIARDALAPLRNGAG